MKWYRIGDSTRYDLGDDGVVCFSSPQWVSECGNYVRRLYMDRHGGHMMYAKLFLKYKTCSRWCNSLENAVSIIEFTPHKLKKAMFEDIANVVNVEIPLGLLSPEDE